MTKIDWVLLEAILKPALERRPEKCEFPDRPRASTAGTEFDIAREKFDLAREKFDIAGRILG